MMRTFLSNSQRRRWFVIAAIVTVVALFVAVPRAQGGACTGRYTMTNGTVLDNDTKLTWQQIEDSGAFGRSEAINYCQALNLQGGGWRLPTMLELHTIIDKSKALPAIDTAAFPQTIFQDGGYYWSSTFYANSNEGYGWGINFAYGTPSKFDVPYQGHVRCVR